MAKFTRAEIRAIIGEACTDEMENKLVALHLGVVDPLKDDLQKYKTEAEKIPGIQKQLDEANKGGDYKERYEQLQAQIEGEKTQKAKEKAARAHLKSKGITDDASLDLAMMAASGEITKLEMDGEKIKDTAGLDGLLSGTLAKLVTHTQTEGTKTPNPAGTGGGKLTRKEIYKTENGRYVLSASERQAALKKLYEQGE